MHTLSILKTSLQRHFLFIIFILVFSGHNNAQSDPKNGWPEATFETKPWTRWWWHGSAVTKQGITRELQMMKDAGIGGVEITPIYGAYGHEQKFIRFLSEQWIDMLLHTIAEAKRLGLGVDMATGTGWPFGGPWISEEDACKNFQIRLYVVRDNASRPEKIEYIQKPYLRTVGLNIPSVQSPAKVDTKEIEHNLENIDLQKLAIDQVQFERKLPIVSVIAFSENNTPLDITSQVSSGGVLQWKYPGGEWKIYALFQGWHGKFVERAAPGGEGNVIDHFSKQALQHYLSRFDSAFQGRDITSLRAFFNDSYEVDDARGAADWTPHLLEEFRKRRGYDLLHYLPQLHRKDTTTIGERVLCDYRETIAELLVDNFTTSWRAWAHQKNALVRNQAHGSPANILDLYSIVDIPEIEGTEPLRIKMASSAAHVSGKRLISAEAATWLNEHFESDLGEVKDALDRFMLNGVNHLVYHGTTYSPEDEPWPGWLFYAAVHFNSRNPQWKNFGALNEYVSRCQSFLQNSHADNDILLYYPIYDPYSTWGPETLEHFDGIGKQFEGTSFARCADIMLQKGYSFDYISDTQIKQLSYRHEQLVTKANTSYKTIVVPHCKYMPLATLNALTRLIEQGAVVIFFEGLPQHASGLATMDNNEIQFKMLSEKILKAMATGKVQTGTNIDQLLIAASVRRETLGDEGIQFIRKRDHANNAVYFIKNANVAGFNNWLTLNYHGTEVEIFNPKTGTYGKGKTKPVHDGMAIFVQLQPGETMILRAGNQHKKIAAYPFFRDTEIEVPVSRPWHLEYVSGGPILPPGIELHKLTDWTTLSPATAVFSGTAVYTTSFELPTKKAKHWKLDLGDVKESVAVFINERYAGTLFHKPYTLSVAPGILQDTKNVLKIVVSNSMANRIIDMDKKKIPWKKFYNVNVAARKPENRVDGIFDASSWKPKPSGLIGPVRFIGQEPLNE